MVTVKQMIVEYELYVTDIKPQIIWKFMYWIILFNYLLCYGKQTVLYFNNRVKTLAYSLLIETQKNGICIFAPQGPNEDPKKQIDLRPLK